MMRTTFTIDDTSIQKLMYYTQKNNANLALRSAVDDFIEQAQLKEVLALRGAVAIEDNWQSLRQLDVSPLEKKQRAK